MLSRLELLIDLLHSSSESALATRSVQLPGYPFASAVPFVTDAQHRPVLLISSLAEHTRNLAADPKASLMIVKPLGDGEMARVSLVGEIQSFDAEPLLVRRYLRYHPPAERFLQLGDFRFHRFEPLRVLTVGGFAQARWLEGEHMHGAPHLSLDDEAALLEGISVQPESGARILGIDCYGLDLMSASVRHRLRFASGPVTTDALLPTVLRELRGAGIEVAA